MRGLVTGIVQHENGMQPYPREIVDAGVGAALTGRPVRPALPAPTVTVDTAGRAATADQRMANPDRSEEHTSELQSLMRISYAVFCLKKKKEVVIEKRKSNNE